MKNVLLFALALVPMAAQTGGSLPEPEALRHAESYMRELQRLNQADSLLQIQLNIAKKLSECQQTGYSCQGLDMLPSAPASSAASSDMFSTPQLIGLYQGRAQLMLEPGRRIEVRDGQKFGPWQVHAIKIDSIQLRRKDGPLINLPIQTP